MRCFGTVAKLLQSATPIPDEDDQGPEPSQKSAAFRKGFAISSATRAAVVFPTNRFVTATAGRHSAERHLLLPVYTWRKTPVFRHPWPGVPGCDLQR